MRQIVLDSRSLLAIIDALRQQIIAMEKQLADLDEDEKNDDLRADLLNDVGFLRSLVSELEREVRLDLDGH
jgi:hypothetical protein